MSAFTLEQGHILGLIGPNGAGKTTLFNVINGVYKPEKGRIIFRGEDITGKPPYEAARRGLARTYQVVRPLQELTVRENVMVGACFGREKHHKGPAAEIADEVLETVGLRRTGRPTGRQPQRGAEKTSGDGSNAGGPAVFAAAGRGFGWFKLLGNCGHD